MAMTVLDTCRSPLHEEIRFGFPAGADLVRACRLAARAMMEARALPEECVDTALIVISELVTNAVLHAAGEWVELRLRLLPDEIVVAVWDPADDLPVKEARHADCEAEGGRGLYMVDLLTEGNWATTTSPDRGGKTVTAHLKRPPVDQIVAA